MAKWYAMGMLKENDKAPLSVALTDASGAIVSLAHHKGEVVVLYFYPKDDTPGCTVEAKAFEDYSSQFKKLGVTVIGVSKDTEKSHQKFAGKYDLSFQLWSDVDQKLIDAFGVWQLKKFMGREYMGIVRATFIIDGKGTIVKVFPDVSPKAHGEEVYKFLKDFLK